MNGRKRSSATWLAWAYALLVLYASLYPFWPWNWPATPALSAYGLPWPRYWGVFDNWINVLGYLPLGFLSAAAVLRSRGPLWLAGVLGFVAPSLLSHAVEWLQFGLPRRVPSMADFLLNSAGALIGMLLAMLLHASGLLLRWRSPRERWFVPNSAGAVALLALWPVALLYPLPLPLGLGQLLPRLRDAASAALEGTRWALPPSFEPAAAGGLPPGLEVIGTALGLLAPCLLLLSSARPGRHRAVLVIGAAALGVAASAASAALHYGPQHLGAWPTVATWPGLAGGGVLALLACLLSRRANAAWGLVVMMALIQLVSLAPPDPYLQLTLQDWEQGRFINLYGLVQWLAWCWPFAALGWLLYAVTQRNEVRGLSTIRA